MKPHLEHATIYVVSLCYEKMAVNTMLMYQETLYVQCEAPHSSTRTTSIPLQFTTAA